MITKDDAVMRWLVLLLIASFDVSAQSPEQPPLVPWNALWTYSILDGDPGPGWKDPDFDDTSWPEGRAPLGLPINIPTEPACGDLSLDELGAAGTHFPQNPNQVQITTYYRTHFNFGDDPSQTSLIFSNLCEDGCVAYLNGQEIVRFRMPSGPITFTTPASARTSMSDIVRRGGDWVGLDGSALRTGKNVLAIELHQNSTSSGTLYQMTSLQAVRGFGPVNAEPSPPADATVLQGRGLLLNSAFLGSLPLTYQWFFDPGTGAMPITQATNASYSLRDMTAAQAGEYFVRATGFEGSVDSRRALVVLMGDLVAPGLVFVRWLDDETVLAQFDEPLEVSPASGTLDPAAYSIQPAGGGPTWTVGSVSATQQNTAVILSQFHDGTQPVRRQVGGSYTLQVHAYHLSDPFGNQVDVELENSILSPITILPLDAVWRFNEAGVDLGPNWFATPVDTSGTDWQSGAGVLGQETAGPVVPLIRTDLTAPSEGGPNTHYFVTHFQLPTGAEAIFAAELTYYVDDFAIIYLNGLEARRVGVPPCYGVIGAAVGLIHSTGTVPIAGFVEGENELAVELHQHGTNSSDVVWGCELAVIATPFEKLAIRYLESGEVQLSWNAEPPWILVQSSEPNGIYTPVAEGSPTSPWVISPGPGQALFYRLKWAP